MCRITEIPPEIIMEILYRLPAKSVGRFRSVSKEWLSLLSEPSFIKTHEIINTLNRIHHIIIFKSFDSSGSLSLLPFHENRIEEARLVSGPPNKYAPFDDSDDGLDVIGCCNGLVLLSAFSDCEDDDLTVFNHRLIVLNPTTKDLLELPVCCCFDPDGNHIRHFKEYFLYGFSYDSFTDDYKVVTISYNYRFARFSYDVPTVHVYSLRTKNWRHVIDFPYNLLDTWMSSSSNAFIDGNIHRLAKKSSGYDEPKVIVAFSLADETITEVPSPDDYIMRSAGPCELVDVGGKLGIFRELDCEVWLMNAYGVKESWTKISLHKIPRDVLEPTSLRVFHKDDGKTLVVCRDLKLIYTLEEKGLRKYCNATSRLWKDLIAKAICVESLVSPNNYGRVNQLAS